MGQKIRIYTLVKAAVILYCIEAIHPFENCDDRMGRLCLTVILKRFDGSFSLVPVESGIRAVREDYHGVISESDGLGDCTMFIDLMLM